MSTITLPTTGSSTFDPTQSALSFRWLFGKHVDIDLEVQAVLA